MAMLFGRFEIQSEISKSESSLIYKAFDNKANQVVALKTQSLEQLGNRTKAFVDTLLAEGESTRGLASQNIAVLYGAGEVEGQFCAAMEYIQGNSVATMLARKEGFSIWDLLDISRQVCAALKCADAQGVAHSSLEPEKIMVQWDGLVKILGYGISNMSLIGAESGNGLGPLMPYCSPEQIRGEAIDQRSNLFTLGTILYEMVAGRKAFDAEDPVVLVGQIENEMPAAPASLNPKVHAAVSAIVMRALAKDPVERYQTASDLMEDLEQCKDSGKKAPAEVKKAGTGTTARIDPAARAAAAAKFLSSVGGASELRPAPPSKTREDGPAVRTASGQADSYEAASENLAAQASQTQGRAMKAVAGASSGAAADSALEAAPQSVSDAPSGARLIDLESEEVSHGSANAMRGTVRDAARDSGHHTVADAVLSAAEVEEEPASHTPRIAVDPIMAGGATSEARTGFSDVDELPPLTEPVLTPSVPEREDTPQENAPQFDLKWSLKPYTDKEEKPKIQPREIAQKAIKQIVTIPPRLLLFSTLGAVAVILVVAVALFLHVHSEDDGSTAAPHAIKAEATQQPSVPQPVPPAAQKSAVPAKTLAAPVEAEPKLTVRAVEPRRARIQRAPAPAAEPVVIPGQAFVDSTPQGAPFQLDGKGDPSWVTPFDLTGLTPGKHILVVSKNGYTTEMRSVDIVSGGKSSVVIHLAPINALVVVNSSPAGAEITLDGKVTGRVTPSQFAVEKGTHTVLLKKQGFLDETTTAEIGPGQNFQYAPALRALGNADEIRTVGKLSKLFGRGGGDSTAGMGSVSIHTQPKGAQVAINQRVLDKLSPAEIMIGPGNYVVDITLTGFKPVHKVITVEKGGKVAIDEILERD